MSASDPLAAASPGAGAAATTGAAAGAPATTDDRRHVVLAARGGSVVFAGKVFAWTSRFVIAVFLARILGAEQYGLYNLGLTAATIAASFAVIGLDSAVIRYTSIFARRRDRAGLLGTLQVGIGLPGVAGLAAGAALFAFAEPIAAGLLSEPGAAPILRITAFLVPISVLNRQLGAALQGLKRIEYAILAEQFGQPLVRLAILLVLAVVSLHAAEAAAASTVAAGVAMVILLVFLDRQVGLRRRDVAARRETRVALAFSLPVYFSNVVATIGTHLQVILLSALDTLRAVGIYAIASHINLLASLFHTAVVQSSLAIFAELHDRGDREGLKHLYQTTSKWTFSLNLPLFIVIVLFPAQLLEIFGPDFRDGATALVILGCEALVSSATGTSGAVLDMTGHTRVKFLNSTVAVVVALGLNLLLLPPFGLVGAALAVLGATTAVNLLRLVQIYALLRIQPYRRSFAKPIAAGVVAAGAGTATSLILAGSPLLALGLGAPAVVLTYVGVLRRLGLTDDDRLVLDRARRKLRRRFGNGERDGGRGDEVDDGR